MALLTTWEIEVEEEAAHEVMLRPCAFTLASRISHRTTFPSSFTLLDVQTNDNDLLGQVRVLAARGHLQEALSLFYSLHPSPPHCPQTYATLFHACASHRRLQDGLSLHRYMIAHNPIHPPDLFVTNHLINMYAKFGHLDYAHQLFDGMPRRNLVSWTALISGYALCGQPQKCLSLFAGMLVHHRPNEFAFTSVLSSLAESDGVYGRQGTGIADLGLKLFIFSYKCTLTELGLIVPHFSASSHPYAEAVALMIMMWFLSFVSNCTVSRSEPGLY